MKYFRLFFRELFFFSWIRRDIESRFGILFVLLMSVIANGCKDGGIFSRESTIYGHIEEVAGPPVDSVILIVSVAKALSTEKTIATVVTDNDGNYEAVMDVPRGYSTLMINITYVNNPAFTEKYRGFEVYREGEFVKDCCTAKIGGKTRYDFRVFK